MERTSSKGRVGVGGVTLRRFCLSRGDVSVASESRGSHDADDAQYLRRPWRFRAAGGS